MYRTLAQLERDGLVTSWSDEAKSAQSRRLYRLTPEGERALRVWMGVIKEERDRLDAVLRRYAASGGVDAALAGVEGGWGAVHGPLGVTGRGRRRSRRPDRWQPCDAATRSTALHGPPAATTPASPSSPIAPPCSSRRARRSVR